MIPRKQILSMLAITIIFMAIVNLLAMKALWYSIFWYFDMPMHFIGGFVSSLLILYIFYNKISIYNKLPTFYIIIGIFVMGIGWEVFEYVFNNIIAGQPWNMLDTISDICFDLAGGNFALFLVSNGLKSVKPV